MNDLTIEQKLGRIESTIKDPKFLEGKGLSNEVPNFVFDYDPKYELKVREEIDRLTHKINSNLNYSFKIMEFDLYEIIMKILDEENYLEMVFEFEKEEGIEYTKEAIIDLFKLDSDDNLIVTHIMDTVKSEMDETSKNIIIFLTGVGKAYPILRSHSILNALSQQFDDCPVVLFYPGTFSGNDFKLFNTLEPSNYYRARPLIK